MRARACVREDGTATVVYLSWGGGAGGGRRVRVLVRVNVRAGGAGSQYCHLYGGASLCHHAQEVIKCVRERHKQKKRRVDRLVGQFHAFFTKKCRG